MSRSLPWFKAYTEARWDKKLALLTLAERGVWFNLLCFTSDQTERGLIDASDREALALECAEGDVDILNSTITKLQRVKHLLTVDGRDGWLAFRTYGVRQARKASDEPEATRERKRLERSRKVTRSDGMSRDVTRDSHGNGDVTRLEEEEEKEIRDNPTFSSSGKVISTTAVVAPAAPAAAAANGHNHWTAESAKRTAEEVARKIRLPSGKIADLADYIKACPQLTHELIIGEACTYADWLIKAHKGAEARVFYNRWLKSANQEREQQRLQQQAPLNGKAQLNGSQHQPAEPPRPHEPDAIYDYHLKQREAEAARTRMVS